MITNQNQKNYRVSSHPRFNRQITTPGSTSVLRILSLGGYGDVTQNMFVYEFIPQGQPDKSQIIIVDCGIGFPEEDAFGVDLQIPDTHYLEDKKDRIQAIFITHGHEDHIGAIRFILPILGKNIPIYAPRLAAAFIKARLEESQLFPRLNVYDENYHYQGESFSIEPVRVNHSIPDTFHLAITTPIGTVYHGSDFKFDLFPLDGKQAEYSKIAAIGNKGVLCLLSDSLGSDHDGFSPSERSIADHFREEIIYSKGRVFVTSISSNIMRWSQAIEYAKSAGRKVVVMGFSVDRAINIARELGYLDLNETDIIPFDRAKNFRDNQLIFLVAGFAGQPDSALSKIAMGKHKIKIKAGDKIIFSSPDYIPGTSSSIYELIDTLSRLGALVVYGEKEELHVSGHGYQKEHALLINLVKPKYLLPIGGNYRHVKGYHNMAKNMGYQEESFLTPEYDSVVQFDSTGKVDTSQHASLRKILIDGLGVGDVGTTVLRDRKLLAQDGMFTIIMLVDKIAGKLIQEPVVSSRGFVFVKENTELLNYLKEEAVKEFDHSTSVPANLDYLREEIQGHLEEVILAKTGRQPMVLPLLIEV
ncbi:MAG: ribonuclease J [Candidatus Shapirobacteria bacterium]